MMLRCVTATLAALVLTCWATHVQAQVYRTYEEIGQLLQDAADDYPSLCEFHILGQSVQGRNLWAVNISDNLGTEEDEPEFKYISTMHGNEWVGNEMLLYLIDHMLPNYGSDPQITNLIDEVDIWIVPLMNPDGFVIPQRENANGVDLNRNFPEWTDGDPNTPDGREVETGVIMNWSFAESFTLSANMHTGALVVNYPFDDDDLGSTFSPSPDEDLFVYISEEYSQYNLPMWSSPYFYHGITNGAAWYSISNGMQDWSYRYMGCNEVTLELSDTFIPPASQIPDYWDDNRESMLAYMDTCLLGVRGIVTGASSGLPIEATITVVGRDHEIYTDPDVGDYHRMLMPDTYDLTFEADGYDLLTVEGVVVSSGDATRLDVQLFDAPVVTYPNGGESLTTGVPIDVTWTAGNPAAQFHIQYTDNYGDLTTITDGFERSTLGKDYTTGGHAIWFLTSSSAHGGVLSARAGDIDDDEASWMTRAVGGGDVSFWYRVSSESGYDYFNFYIDDDRDLHVSGTVGWTQYSTTLAAGSHELKWEYDKDGSQSHGSDTVWVDDLEVVVENTAWTDVIALTAPGASSTPWTPPAAGEDYKVRVRSHYEGSYGNFDESDATFSVEGPQATGDYDGDGDVDLADFGAFQGCILESGVEPCNDAFDFVVNGTIDLTDYEEFAPRMTGP